MAVKFTRILTKNDSNITFFSQNITEDEENYFNNFDNSLIKDKKYIGIYTFEHIENKRIDTWYFEDLENA